MKKLILILFSLSFMGASAPVAYMASSAPALAGKAGGNKYRLPHKLKHEKDDKQADKPAQLA